MGFAFLTAVEVLDGFSSEWGASSDIIANASGTALFVSQEYCGRSSGSHQIFFSYHAIRPVQTQCRELTCGTNAKDYNGQTYWLSVNLHSFYKGSKIPKWLNLAMVIATEC
jgi:hypothetical protein